MTASTSSHRSAPWRCGPACRFGRIPLCRFGRIPLCWFGVILLCLGGMPAARAQQRIDLPAGGGVTQPIILHPATQPVANAILFPGGSGAVFAVHNNFLLRVADSFAAAGITVAVADAPSDHPDGMDRPFRATAAQATDTAAIVSFLRSRAPVPVWLVGTSNGTISAANAAARLGPPGVSGLVLTSAVWDGGMGLVPLAEIHVPTLIVHNRHDGCSSSPFAHAAPALTALTAAPATQLVVVSSLAQLGPACGAMSPHGYLHIEDQVVGLIVGWIKTH